MATTHQTAIALTIAATLSTAAIHAEAPSAETPHAAQAAHSAELLAVQAAHVAQVHSAEAHAVQAVHMAAALHTATEEVADKYAHLLNTCTKLIQT